MDESNNVEKTSGKLDSAQKRSITKSMVCGAVIGIGGILPGVSGGVMAVSFGLYRPILDAVAGFFKNIKKNFLFLLPIGIGAVIGLFLGSIALNSVMTVYYTQVMYLFLGLVAGGIPSFIKEANEDGFKVKYLIATLLGALLASMLLFLERDVDPRGDVAALTPLEAIITGAVIAIGSVIPGLSTSVILMYLGWYRPAMAALANLDIITLFFMGIGVVGCAVATIKLARWIFNRFHGYAYYGVLGFLVISALLIFPGFQWNLQQIVNTVLLALGFFAAYMFGRLSNN
jgi:putative membrane protein